MQRLPGRRDPWPLVGLAGAGTFTVLLAFVLAAGGLPFDVPVTRLVQGLGLPVDLWVAITDLGGGPVLIPIGAALALAALLTGRYRLALVVAIVMLGGTVFTEVTKVAVGRLRPPWEHLVDAPGLSFPSGHSLNSTVAYGLLAVVASRVTRLPRILRGLAAVVALVLPVAIGLSRVALGVHYPSDALGGWSAGLAFVASAAVLIVGVSALEQGRLRVIRV